VENVINYLKTIKEELGMENQELFLISDVIDIQSNRHKLLNHFMEVFARIMNIDSLPAVLNSIDVCKLSEILSGNILNSEDPYLI